MVAEHAHGQLAGGVGSAVTAAGELGGAVKVLVAGAGTGDVAQAAAAFEGVTEVLHCLANSPGNEVLLAEDEAQLIKDVAQGCSHVLMADSTHCKQVLPRAAALADVQMLSGVTAVVASDTFVRPVYSGRLLATCVCADPVKFLSVRATAFAPSKMAASATITETPPPLTSGLSTWCGLQVTETVRPELTGADIVVTGGRGMGGKEGFALLGQLADRLNAALGATRAAVDAGDAPNEWQVGQTGKVVAPRLYIAAGVSGAMQHIAGMKDSKTIVAINKDEEAPIMAVADYCLVGDARQAIHELVAAIDNLD